MGTELSNSARTKLTAASSTRLNCFTKFLLTLKMNIFFYFLKITFFIFT